MKSVHLVAIAVGVAAILSVGYAEDTAYTSLSYVQDGLVAQWDGRENVGRGEHSNTTTVWSNLVSDCYHLTWVGKNNQPVRWDGMSAFFARTAQPGNGYFSSGNDIGGLGDKMGSDWTVEVTAMPTAGYWENSAGMCGTDGGTRAPYLGQYEDYPNYSISRALYFKSYSPSAALSTAPNGIAVAPEDIPMDKLCTIAFSDSPTNIWLYLNGGLHQTEMNGAEYNSTVTGINSWMIGTGSRVDGRIFSGNIFSVRIYNRKLTEAEVQQNARIDAIRFCVVPFEVTSDAGLIARDEVSPAYGTTRCNGFNQISFSAPAGEVSTYRSFSVVSNAQVTGWTLYGKKSGSEEYEVLKADDTASGTFMITDLYDGLRLVWHWQQVAENTDSTDVALFKSYPQKGLVAQWDAIWNVRQGDDFFHFGDTAVWSDLVGSHDLGYVNSNGQTLPHWTEDAYVSTWVAGRYEYMRCDNVSDFFKNDVGDCWTLQALVTPTANWASSSSSICGYHLYNNGAVNGLQFGQHMSNGFGFKLYITTTEYPQQSHIPQSEFDSYYGHPLLLTMVVSPTEVKVYRNEQLMSTQTMPSGKSSTLTIPSFLVGCSYIENYIPNYIFDGKIHAVRLYNRTMGSAEIAHTYDIDAQRFGSGKDRGNIELVGYTESTGTQSVSTGVVVPADPRIEADITLPEKYKDKLAAGANANCVFGATFSNNGFLFIFTNEGKIRFHSGGHNKDLAPGDAWQVDERFHFCGDNYGYSVNGTQVDFSGNPGGNVTNPFFLFAVGYGGWVQIHHAALYNGNGEAQFDVHPAKRTDPSGNVEYGFYNLSNDKFIGKTSSGGDPLLGGGDAISFAATVYEVGSAHIGVRVLQSGLDAAGAEVVAVCAHGDKVSELPVATLSANAFDVQTRQVVGLKPDTDYTVYFKVAGTNVRYPAENAFAFHTSAEAVDPSLGLDPDAARWTGRELSVTLSRDAGGAAEDVYAAYGDFYYGEEESLWANSTKVGTFAADAQTLPVTLSEIPKGTEFVRFYIKEEGSDVVGGWSPVLALSDLKLIKPGIIVIVR